MLISFSSCTKKGEVNRDKKQTVYVYDSIESLNYYNEGLKHYNRHSSKDQLKELDSSVYFLKKSILNNNRNISSYEMLITVLFLKKDFQGAENVINEAIEYTSQKAYYTGKKGMIKNKLGQQDSAKYYFNIALQKYYKKEQNLGIKNQIIGILYQMGNKKESLKVLNECFIEYPKDSLIFKRLKEMIVNDQIPRPASL